MGNHRGCVPFMSLAFQEESMGKKKDLKKQWINMFENFVKETNLQIQEAE